MLVVEVVSLYLWLKSIADKMAVRCGEGIHHEMCQKESGLNGNRCSS